MTTATGPTAAIPIDPRIAERRKAVADAEHRSHQRQLQLALAVFAFGVAAFAIFHSPLFAVDQIVVSGTERHVAAVTEASQIDIGQPLIRVDLAKAREAIVDLPNVASVTSRRSWNGEVRFDVVEREPVAMVETSSGTMLEIDAAGRILARQPAGRTSAGLMPIMGLALMDNGQARWVDDDAAEVLRAAAAVPEDVLAVTSQMTVTPTDYRLELTNGAIVILGEPETMEEQMRSLRSVVTEVELGCVDTIDLRIADSPVVRREVGCTS